MQISRTTEILGYDRQTGVTDSVRAVCIASQAFSVVVVALCILSEPFRRWFRYNAAGECSEYMCTPRRGYQSGACFEVRIVLDGIVTRVQNHTVNYG